MKRTRFTLLALALVAPVLLLVGLFAIPTTTHAAPLETVTTPNNSGAGSLRQAIADVDPGGTINFNVSGTIVLASELLIDKELTIDGGNAITISGNNAVRVFNINSDGQATLTHLRIVQGNAVGGMGGGISSTGAVTLTNSTLSGNRSNGGGGGGIHATGPLTIINSTVANNSDYGGTTSGGGGILNYGPTTIRNIVISGNYTPGFGGGISNRGNTTISHSTITNNRAQQGGGGISNSNVALAITHSTIVGNIAESSFFGGGGMLVSSGSTSMGHTIVANNSFGNCRGTVNSLGYNLIDVTTECIINGDTTGNITGQNPNLGALQDNGGPTFSHKPNIGSPAINAGASDCGTTVDQRGRHGRITETATSARWRCGRYSRPAVAARAT